MSLLSRYVRVYASLCVYTLAYVWTYIRGYSSTIYYRGVETSVCIHVRTYACVCMYICICMNIYLQNVSNVSYMQVHELESLYKRLIRVEKLQRFVEGEKRAQEEKEVRYTLEDKQTYIYAHMYICIHICSVVLSVIHTMHGLLYSYTHRPCPPPPLPHRPGYSSPKRRSGGVCFY